ncbi:MAG: hypothetical protein EOO10_22255 [Chitinophagaceae bacterium]|nr:MAG: hypothetical protein EOO10_22255 [Chitinophagaceae bacterium]
MLTTDTIIIKKRIKRDQTALDYTVQNAGTLESLFDVLQLNGIGATDDIPPGAVLLAPVEEKKVIGYYNQNTELDIITMDKSNAVPGGIGYMEIGNSFIVS